MDSAPVDLARQLSALVERVAALEQEMARLRGREGDLALAQPEPGATPPPPPPLPLPPQADPDELERLRAKNAQLLADCERIEGEHQALKLKLGSGGEAGGSPSATPQGAELRDLRARHERLRRDHEALQEAHAALQAQPAQAQPAPAGEGAGSDSRALQRLEQEHAALRRDYEALAAAARGDLDEAALGSDDPAAVRAEVQRLMKQRLALEQEVARIRKEATRTIKRLKQQKDTMKLQRENLLKELESRDSGSGPVNELTLEEITDSPVFKAMLGNIRRTSREEVTLLHDAVVSLGKIDPVAYNKLLAVVAAKFKAANVENPLMLLEPIE